MELQLRGLGLRICKHAGNPVELGAWYAAEGIDELVFLDITATHEKRKTMSALAREVAKNIHIPFTIGGGISSVNDVQVLLASGADKISINSAAYKNPSMISQLAKEFGSQCVVVAIDTKKEEDGHWYVYLNGGRIKTNTKCIDWAKQIADLGGGEILLTSMNNDGTKTGFAIDITRSVGKAVSIPVIASGGCGSLQHFYDVFVDGEADAALVASIFHFKELTVAQVKCFLSDKWYSSKKIEIAVLYFNY